MPRSKPRFSDLKDKMITALASGQDPKTSFDTEVAKFSQWYLEPQNRVGIPSASTRKRGTIINVSVYPFSQAGSGTTPPVLTTMSIRAANWLKGKTAILAATRIVTAAGTIATAAAIKNFFPAQAAIRRYDPTGTVTERTSQITGRRYKTQFTPGDEGYILPFGTNTAGDRDISEVQDDIKVAIAAETSPPLKVLTFKPEEFVETGVVYSWV